MFLLYSDNPSLISLGLLILLVKIATQLDVLLTKVKEGRTTFKIQEKRRKNHGSHARLQRD